jgi:hypothetical protein
VLFNTENESTTLDEVVLLQDSLNRLVLMESNSEDLTFQVFQTLTIGDRMTVKDTLCSFDLLDAMMIDTSKIIMLIKVTKSYDKFPYPVAR